jgi:hypothetical protein
MQRSMESLAVRVDRHQSQPLPSRAAAAIHSTIAKNDGAVIDQSSDAVAIFHDAAMGLTRTKSHVTGA